MFQSIQVDLRVGRAEAAASHPELHDDVEELQAVHVGEALAVLVGAAGVQLGDQARQPGLAARQEPARRGVRRRSLTWEYSMDVDRVTALVTLSLTRAHKRPAEALRHARILRTGACGGHRQGGQWLLACLHPCNPKPSPPTSCASRKACAGAHSGSCQQNTQGK